jgi:hypothetical protein
MATLTWTDTLPSASAYQIEQLGSDGTWAAIDSVPGHAASHQTLSWNRPVNITTTLRVEAMLSSYSVPLQTTSGQGTLHLVVPATAPTITLSHDQPITGSVVVSISGGGTYSSVNYYVDLNGFASSTTAPTYAVTLDTRTLTAGSHLLLARLATSADAYIEQRLPVQVANSAVAVQIQVQGTTGTAVPVVVTASSDLGIHSVTASVDGASLGTVTAPNGCGSSSSSPCSLYGFTVNALSVGSGQHTFTAQATDAGNNTATASTTATFNNPPALNVTSPQDGALVYGTLHLAGTFSSDKAGSVMLTATLGSLPLLTTSGSPFATDFNLAGVTPGDYTLTVTATDSTGQSWITTDIIAVTSSAALVYTPLASVGENGSLVAADNQTLLYRANYSDGPLHLLAGSTDTTLAVSGTMSYYNHWTVNNGSVFASDINYVHLWSPSGTQSNLSALAQSNGTPDELLAVHWPWVLWESHGTVTGSQTTDTYTFYNISNAQKVTVPAPTGAVALGNGPADFYVTQSGLQLYYYAIFPTNPGINVFHWDQSTGQTSALTSESNSGYPQTDGHRVAWQIGSLATNPPFGLVALDIPSGTQQTLSSTMSRFQLADGVLAWAEQTPSSADIMASNGTTTSTVSSRVSSVLFGTGGGYVAFEEDSKLHVWSAAGGRQLIFDAAPGGVLVSGKTVYFITGNRQKAVYSVTLN